METDKVWVVHQSGYDGDSIVAFCKSEASANKARDKYNTVYEPAYITVHELQ